MSQKTHPDTEERSPLSSGAGAVLPSILDPETPTRLVGAPIEQRLLALLPSPRHPGLLLQAFIRTGEKESQLDHQSRAGLTSNTDQGEEGGGNRPEPK